MAVFKLFLFVILFAPANLLCAALLRTIPEWQQEFMRRMEDVEKMAVLSPGENEQEEEMEWKELQEYKLAFGEGLERSPSDGSEGAIDEDLPNCVVDACIAAFLQAGIDRRCFALKGKVQDYAVVSSYSYVLDNSGDRPVEIFQDLSLSFRRQDFSYYERNYDYVKALALGQAAYFKLGCPIVSLHLKKNKKINQQAINAVLKCHEEVYKIFLATDNERTAKLLRDYYLKQSNVQQQQRSRENLLGPDLNKMARETDEILEAHRRARERRVSS